IPGSKIVSSLSAERNKGEISRRMRHGKKIRMTNMKEKKRISPSGSSATFSIPGGIESSERNKSASPKRGSLDKSSSLSSLGGTKACDDAGKSRVETVPGKYYILLPLWTADPPFSQSSKSSQDNEFQPSSDNGKKVDEDSRQESECHDQEKIDNVNSTNNVNVAGINRVNVVGGNTNNELLFDTEMHELEDVNTFNFSNKDEDDGAEANMNNLDTAIQVSPTLTTRIQKDHLLDQRAIGTKLVFRNKKDEKGIAIRKKARFHRGKIEKTLFIRIYKDDILLVQVYVDDIIFGSTKKELCNAFEKMMHEKFQISSIRELTLFLRLQVKQKQDGIFISQDKYVAEILKKYGFSEVKNASTPMETQKPLLKDEDGEEVDVHMYRSMTGSLINLTFSRLDIMFIVCACVRHQVNLMVSHLYDVKRIFRYLKGQAKSSLWYPNDSPFDLVAYADSDYARASLDRKSTTGGFEQIIDFLNAHSIKYALRVNPTIYISCTEQFWATTKVKNINGTAQLHAKVDGKKLVISEASIKRDLQFGDEGRVDCLPNEVIFEQLTHMGAATTTSSLEVERDIGNIDKTQSKATPNESSSQRTDSGGGLRCQEAIGDTIAQTRSKRVSKISNDPLLAGVNTPRSGEDILKLNELMDLCTSLQNGVLALEATKTSQTQEIDSLKRRGRIINELDADEDITLVNDQEMFDADKDLQGKEVVFEQEIVVDKEPIVDAAQVSAAITTVTIDDITLAKALKALKTSKLKIREIIIKDHEEPSKSRTTTTIFSKKSHENGKAKMIEEPLKLKKKDQILFDEEVARNLQEEINEEEILVKVDADYQLAERMQAEEQQELNKEEKDLKNKCFAESQELFDKAIKRINTFVDFRTELVEESLKKVKAEITQKESSKREGDELEQETAKKQKIVDDNETKNLKQLVKIIPEEDIAINAIPLAVKTPIVD
nr:uncharacterized mitochondrial protein AtMg00810-like [Tanacetum cinerariifolium]